MPTSVTVNGGYIIPGPNNKPLLVVDATVGSAHHQAVFLAEDVLAVPSGAARLKYIAQQMKSVDTASGSITAAPSLVPGITGTVSV